MVALNEPDRSSGNAVHSTTGGVFTSSDLGGFNWGCDSEPLQSWELDSQPFVREEQNILLLNSCSEPANSGDLASLDRLTPAERRAQSNKLAQRRARARRKTLAQGAEAQLAVTSAELQELQNKQKALEARNNLLEKVVQLGQTQQSNNIPLSTAVGVPDLKKTCGFEELPGPAAKLLASIPGVRLTLLPHREQLLELKEIACMSSRDIAKIYTHQAAKQLRTSIKRAKLSVQEYINRFKELLATLGQREDSEVRQQLNLGALEIRTLILVTPLLFPGRMKQYGNCSMADGSVHATEAINIDDQGAMAVLHLTADQEADLLFLRGLFFGKIGQLARQRHDIAQCMSINELALLRDGERHTQLEELSSQLRQNGMEDYRTHVQYTEIMYDGILTSQQFATALVYAYPFIPRHKRWPEMLATQQGEPSVQQLANNATLTDEQHAANWDAMVQHLSCLAIEQKEQYVPLPR